MNNKKQILYYLYALCCICVSINSYAQAYDVCGNNCDSPGDIDAVVENNEGTCPHAQWFALYDAMGTFVSANMTGDFTGQPTGTYTLYGINYQNGTVDAANILDAIQAMNGLDIDDLLTGGSLENADCFDLIQRSASVNTDPSCNCSSCPTVDMDVDYEEDLCASGTPDYAAAKATIQVSDDAFVRDTTFWLDNSTDPPTMPATALSYGDGGTTNNCDPDMVTVYAYVECDEELDGTIISYLPAGSFEVTIYPDINDQGNMVMNDNTCCPSFTLDANCGTNYTVTNSLDANGDTPDCTNVTTNDMITFTVALNNPPTGLAADCASVDYTADYLCGTCPTVTTEVNHNEDLCVSGTPNYTVAETTIQVSDDTYVKDITFWLNSADPPTMSAGALSYGDGGATNNCDPDVVTVYAYVECDNNEDGATDSYIAAGSFEVTLYPDISNQVNMAMGANTCCPSFTLDANCAANYTVTNDLDNANGSTPDCSSVTTNGMVTFTVALNNPPTGLAADCASVAYPVAYRCNPCPIATTPVSWQEDFCVTGEPNYVGAGATIVVDDPDMTLAGISFWLDNVNPPTMPVPTALTYNGDGCVTETIPIYAFLECDDNGDGITDSYIDAGSFEVNLYPDIANQNNMVTMDGGCCPSLSLACTTGYTVDNDFDMNGTTPNCENTFDAGNITFTITNENAPNTVETCWEHTIVVNYDCLECPTVTSEVNWSETFCGSGSVDEIGAINTITFNDPSGLANGVSLWFDNGTVPTMPLMPEVSYEGDGCATDNQIIYAFVECDEDQDGTTDTFLPAGSFQVEIYRDLSSISIINEGGCCPSLDFNCTTGYTILNFLDDNGGNPTCDGSAGVLNFRVTNDNAPESFGTCQETILTSTYDCRVCPTITTPINWSEAFCTSGMPNYTGAAATIGIEDPSGVRTGVTFWLDTLGTIPAPNFMEYQGTGCTADVLTIYALIGCDRNEDGMVEQQIDAGSFEVTIYPEVRQPAIIRTMVGTDECSYEVIPACPEDILDMTTFGPLAVVSLAGTTPIQVTTGIQDSPCSGSITFNVPHEACSICPFNGVLTTTAQGLGVTPFLVNETTIAVTGALPPLNYKWSYRGLVRRRVMTNDVELSTDIIITYRNGATWTVTITDANGCEIIRTNAGGENIVLDIDEFDIQAASSPTATDGAIDISLSGGTPPYAYQWFGSIGFSATTEDVSGLHYGWHKVTITDSSVPQQITSGNYYVPFGSSTAGGGFIRGKVRAVDSPVGFLGATPNPFTNQTTIAFAVNQAVDQAFINVYTLNGQKVAELYAGALALGEHYTVDFISDGLTAGIYILQLTADNGIREQFKLVVVD